MLNFTSSKCHQQPRNIDKKHFRNVHATKGLEFNPLSDSGEKQ